jgi:hypothetical protein
MPVFSNYNPCTQGCDLYVVQTAHIKSLHSWTSLPLTENARMLQHTRRSFIVLFAVIILPPTLRLARDRTATPLGPERGHGHCHDSCICSPSIFSNQTVLIVSVFLGIYFGAYLSNHLSLAILISAFVFYYTKVQRQPSPR